MKCALIGRGKLASHLDHWWSMYGIEFTRFDRNSDFSTLNKYTHIFLAITDKEIFPFYEQFHYSTTAKWVHFSGSHYFHEIIGLHPLMSFSDTMFDKEFYNNLLWVSDHPIKISEFFPVELKNILEVSPQNKPLYHALCVMSGNIPHLLWNQVQEDFKKLDIPESAIKQYIRVTTENFLNDRSPTGPIVRNDTTTIEKNLTSLQTHHKKIYQAVMENFNEKNH